MTSIAITRPRPSLIASTGVIAKRSVLKFFRTPQLLWTVTMQGVLFLLTFRCIFGGAIGAGQLGYVDFVVPGIITTLLIWQGMGSAVGVTEDHTSGLHDRLRSLPIPRSAVLAGRALADTATLAWGLVIMTILGFAIGFRLHDGIANGLLAFALVLAFGFAFEWVSISVGLYASNAQAAQGIGLILVPLHLRIERVCAGVLDAELARDGGREPTGDADGRLSPKPRRRVERRSVARSPGEPLHRPLRYLVGGHHAGVRRDRDRLARYRRG